MSEVPSAVHEELRRAAFGPAPATALPPVAPGSADAWLAAVALGARGRYAAAATHLQHLVRSPDPVLAALAAATRASHLRQLGGHAAARPLDARGLHRLTAAGLLESGDAAEAVSDVLLGLAADAVGLGRLGEARRLLALDRGAAGERAEIRRGWLRAEVELASGNGRGAVAPARAAVAAAAGHPSTRHRVKSAVILAVALVETGERDEAEGLLNGAVDAAVAHGFRPLVWPAALVLLQLGQTERREQAAAMVHCVLRHSDPIARRHAEGSPWVPTWLFASAPNR